MDIESIKTEDGVGLQLGYFAPAERDAPVVLLTHGVANSFTNSPMWGLAKRLNAAGHGVAVLNNRGHDWVSMNPLDRRWTGAAYERIEDSVHDFNAAVKWLRKQGNGQVVIGGHSLGGLKAAYTVAHALPAGVMALAMVSSPRLPDDQVWEWSKHEAILERCRQLADAGKGQELMHVEMPTNTPAMKGLMSADTYMNKYGPQAATTALRYASRITLPVFLLAGSEEKPQLSFSLDMERALADTQVRRITVHGSDHMYTGKLDEVASQFSDWLDSLAPAAR